MANALLSLSQKAERAARDKQSAEQSWKKLPPLHHKYRSYRHPKDDEHRTAEQLQWKRQNTLNWLALMASCIAAFAAYLAWQESRRQAATADDQLQAMRDEQRPWLSFKRKEGGNMGSWPNAPQMDFSFIIQIENMGKLPAYNLTFTAMIVAAEYNKSSTEETCKTANNFFGNKLGVLLPEEMNARDGLIGKVSYTEMQKTAMSLSIGHKVRARNLAVVGCVTFFLVGAPLCI